MCKAAFVQRDDLRTDTLDCRSDNSSNRNTTTKPQNRVFQALPHPLCDLPLITLPQ